MLPRCYPDSRMIANTTMGCRKPWNSRGIGFPATNLHRSDVWVDLVVGLSYLADVNEVQKGYHGILR